MKKNILISFIAIAVLAFIFYPQIEDGSNKLTANSNKRAATIKPSENIASLSSKHVFSNNLSSGVAQKSVSVKGSISIRELADQFYNNYSGSTNRDEKLNLISELTILYISAIDKETKIEILARLKKIASSNEDNELRAFAAINYSRISPTQDGLDIIISAFRDKAIDSDSYYAELSRIALSSSIDQNTKSSLISEVVSANNKYSKEVLFSTIPNIDLASVDKTNMTLLLDFVQNSKPSFPIDISALGVSSAMEYTNWLHSMAKLSTMSSDSVVIDDYLINFFRDGFTDPREAVAIYIDKPVGNYYSNEFNQKVRDEVEKYSVAYPNNQIVQEIRGSIRK